MNKNLKNEPKVSIGLPVFNGEKFLRERIDSILKQSYSDFEIIISDNASTDSTPEICKEFLEKNKNIQYFRQEKNIGGMNNYSFVLTQAKGEFFVWAAVDDMWHEDFIKKNLMVMINNKDLVGSVSKEKIFSPSKEDLVNLKNYSKTRKFFREKLISMRPNLYPISGSYLEKIRKVLITRASNMLYGLMRRKALLKSITNERFLGDEWCVMLNVVKYGNYNEINEQLLYRFERGASWHGIIYLAKNFNKSLLGKIFPNYPLTRWCAKNLGVKIFLRNFDLMIWINIEVGLNIIFEILLGIKNKIIR